MSCETKPRYYELNKEIYARKIIYADIAEAIDRSVAYVALRMQGKKGWQLDECYAILAMIEADPESLTIYFPPKETGEVQYGQTYTQPA